MLASNPRVESKRDDTPRGNGAGHEGGREVKGDVERGEKEREGDRKKGRGGGYAIDGVLGWERAGHEGEKEKGKGGKAIDGRGKGGKGIEGGERKDGGREGQKSGLEKEKEVEKGEGRKIKYFST